jgi:hypothetical protein
MFIGLYLKIRSKTILTTTLLLLQNEEEPEIHGTIWTRLELCPSQRQFSSSFEEKRRADIEVCVEGVICVIE